MKRSNQSAIMSASERPCLLKTLKVALYKCLVTLHYMYHNTLQCCSILFRLADKKREHIFFHRVQRRQNLLLWYTTDYGNTSSENPRLSGSHSQTIHSSSRLMYLCVATCGGICSLISLLSVCLPVKICMTRP